MNYKEEIENLKHYAKMQTSEDIKLFEKTVYKLVETKDSQILEELIDIFDDNCEFPEVMYNLVHAVETYPNQVYIEKLLEKIEYGIKHYPFWMEILVNRVFNDENCLNIFKNKIHNVSDKALEKLFFIMEDASPHQLENINKLRKLI